MDSCSAEVPSELMSTPNCKSSCSFDELQKICPHLATTQPKNPTQQLRELYKPDMLFSFFSLTLTRVLNFPLIESLSVCSSRHRGRAQCLLIASSRQGQKLKVDSSALSQTTQPSKQSIASSTKSTPSLQDSTVLASWWCHPKGHWFLKMGI